MNHTPLPTPLIGITAASEKQAREYAGAVERNGGSTRLIVPSQNEGAEKPLSEIAGLLVAGGGDIEPSSYGEPLDPDAGVETDEGRDAVELPVLKGALDADLPVLGICRGMQALNVAMGGRLIQHLSGHGAEEKDGHKASSYHRIYITPGSKLAAVVGAGGFVRVNSWHHQGVREAQKSRLLMASAYSLEDGIIEGLESPDHDWVIGVQFHPELRKEVPPHFERLFQGLVERAARHASMHSV